MTWPVRALIGPMLWAIAFAVIYASHGYGCARAWPTTASPVGNLQSFVLISLWITALAGLLGLNLRKVEGEPTVRKIVRAADRMGLGATFLTLLPVMGLTTCG